MATALITGVTGQDGSYLVDALGEGWDRHAIVRPTPEATDGAVPDGVTGHEADLGDPTAIAAVVAAVEPDVVFNLGGISSVARSWNDPIETARVTGVAVAALLDATWRLQESSGKQVRFVQASSSEIFGRAAEVPQNESTPVVPASPYGAAKAFAHGLVGVYRARGMHASTAILYNHESPRRPPAFVTRKITGTVARITRGLEDGLVLGDLDVERDWGWAPDYVDAMVRMSRHPEPGDYIVATGIAHTVRDFVDAAFRHAGILEWRDLVSTDPEFIRPVETPRMLGDASRAREILHWVPTVAFDELVARMVDADLALLDAEPQR